ncbi:MAG: hypothetical protein AAGU76_13255 [Sedimentibacter sp.]|uniref:hypothetical protein n=1 Tax=Sedimentibacter sp. TaxID=1960295 RepID=UPI003158EEBB
MDFASIVYALMVVVVTFFITINIRSNIKYKKENMQVLLHLKYDDKSTHLISSIVMVILIIFAGFSFIGMITTKNYTNEAVMASVILPVMLIFLYLPMMKKTRISTLGIHKKNYLIRWDEIKGINYNKPDSKNRVRVKIIYSVAARDTSAELTFMKDDAQLDEFKEIVKEYRSKKKDKKSGK